MTALYSCSFPYIGIPKLRLCISCIIKQYSFSVSLFKSFCIQDCRYRTKTDLLILIQNVFGCPYNVNLGRQWMSQCKVPLTPYYNAKLNMDFLRHKQR